MPIGAYLALAYSTPLYSTPLYFTLFHFTLFYTIFLYNIAKDTKLSLVNLRAGKRDSHIRRQYIFTTRLLKGKI